MRALINLSSIKISVDSLENKVPKNISRFSTTSEDNRLKIKIGSQNNVVKGRYTYKIEYSYSMGEDLFKDRDEFIFYPYGFLWSTEINNATFSIKMPKEFDESELKIWADKAHKKEANIDYYVSGDVIYGEVKDEIKSGDGIAINLRLEDGYFEGAESNYGNKTLISYIISISIAVISFILWLIFGKDKHNIIETVEFYPPKGMNCAEVGIAYSNQGTTTSTMITSLILELASKGYIEIDNGENEKDIIVKKKKEYDGNNEVEIELLKGIFKDNKKEVNLSEDEEFYKTIDTCKIILSKTYKKKIFDAKSLELRTLNIILSVVSVVTFFIGIAMEDMPLMNGMINIFKIAIFAPIITIFLSFIMIKRTKYGEEVLGKIRGFRTFLMEVKKEELENIVEKDIQYYYQILPYAYVLGDRKSVV